jgi:hypothetical protein
MNIRIAIFAAALCMTSGAYAVQDEASATSPESKPEEIVIIGVQQLRKQMMAAEVHAYDIFNQFNDEKRFKISCSDNAGTGSHFTKQTCAPEFEIRATSAHAGEFMESMHNFRSGDGQPDGNVVPQSAPMEIEIGRQQTEYKKKIKRVAEQHPEFLEAVKQYSKLREQYQGAEATEKK